MSPAPTRLAKDLWRWTARHPEWHPGDFGAEVACFAIKAGEDSLLIDPLLLPEPQPVLDLVGEILGARLAILITIPYHVRSAEEIRRRFRKETETTIHGHPAVAKRLGKKAGFEPIDPGTPLPAGVSAYTIGKPRRFETPLLVPSQRALVFGDAVAETGGRLRVWAADRVDARVERFYRERFNPTLVPLLELDFDRVLVTHGQPVMQDGKKALRSALRSKPWYHGG
jgi:glyoxylase-like metal-dependent hydrolase (beta-lactamase superfamily II)